MMLLDPRQALVVSAPLDQKQMVVMAGPGSGKTRTAVERVKLLLGAGQKVVVITYTNAAAQEFSHRLEAPRALGIHAVSDRVPVEFCGTLHAYCLRLVRRYYAWAGYDSPNVTVLPEGDRDALLKQQADKLGIKYGVDKIKKQPSDPLSHQVWLEYYFILHQNNLIDYEHILARGVDLLLDEKVKRTEKIDTLVVDEAQDSAAIDWAVYLAIPAKQRFFIGDPDQAIFEWREAYPQGLIDKGKDPESTVYRLEYNYRCAPEICDTANNLIKHNVSRFEKDTVPAHDAYLSDAIVTVVPHDDEWQELEWLAMAIRRWQPDNQCAVLCRYNWDIDQIRRYLPTIGIHVYAARDAQDARPQDWRRAMLLIGLATSPHNEYLAEQFLLLDNAAHQVRQWKLEAQADKVSLASHRLGFNPTSGKLQSWGVDRWTLLEFLGKNGVYAGTIGLIAKHLEDLPPDATLGDLLDELYQVRERPEPQGAHEVYVGTIHSAKGREFGVVFLPCMEEQPKRISENIEEERRLIYVALTRARHAVHISWARTRKPRWGPAVQREPSRFIEEMEGKI